MKIINLLAATALAAPAMLAFSAPAQAQVAGIATADPTLAIARSRAFNAANQQIQATYKDNFDKLKTKSAEVQKVLAQLDKNGDKRVDDAEFDAAEKAKSPAYTQYVNMQNEMLQLQNPAVRATAFAIEMILQRYEEAQKSAITSKKVNVILAPEAFVYMPDNTDITPAITTALDTIVPTVPITAPQNWQPSQDTVAVLQRINRLTQALVAQQQAQQRPAGAAPAPAASAPKPQQPAQPR